MPSTGGGVYGLAEGPASRGVAPRLPPVSFALPLPCDLPAPAGLPPLFDLLALFDTFLGAAFFAVAAFPFFFMARTLQQRPGDGQVTRGAPARVRPAAASSRKSRSPVTG